MRTHLTKALVGLLALLVVPLVGVTPPPARASSPCPDIHYLGNYPDDTDLSWSENVQGIAHDDSYWFVTNVDHLHRIPLGDDLAESPTWNSTNRVGLPPGYNHFGDLDQYGGYLFVPLQGDGKAAIAAYGTDLSLHGIVDITPFQDETGWVAVNPVDGDVYTSRSWVAKWDPLFRYHLDLEGLRATGTLEGNLSYDGDQPLYQQDGSPFADRPALYRQDPPEAHALGSMQGGAFTPWGELFVSNGYYDQAPSYYRGGIHLFGTNWRMITESTNGSGDFNYEYHPEVPTGHEPEGLDWFRHAQNSGAPGISGDLHALLLNNDRPDGDNLWLKHYSVDWFCDDGIPPTVIGSPDRPANAAGWYDAPVTIDWHATDASGAASDPADTVASVEGAAVGYVSGPSCDRAGNCGVGSLNLSIDFTDPAVACQPATFVLHQPDATVSANVTDAVSGPSEAVVTAPANTSVVGNGVVNLTGTDNAGRHTTVACPYSVVYNFDGFLSPVVNPPAVNRTAAGRVIAVRWRVTDFNGAPVDSAANFVALTSAPCSASDTGNAESSTNGVRSVGDGTWQFNWQTPRAYAQQCRTMRLTLADGSVHTATFRFQ